MPANIETMFSVRERPWHDQGVILDEPPSGVQDALEKSGLDWEVVKLPLYVPDSANMPVEVDDFQAIVRQDTGLVLGVVGNRYEPVQNVEAFQFLDNLLGTDLLFETAGSIASGKRIWVLTKVPAYVEIGGDNTEQFVLFHNSHDGKSSVAVLCTLIRVVCQNTLNSAIRGAKNTYKFRHVGDPSLRIHEAREVLQIAIDYGAQFKILGDQLASQKMTDNKLSKVIDELWPAESDRAVANRDNVRSIILNLHKGSNTVGNSPQTKWSGYNAIVEYLDWYRPTRGDSDRFARINFEATNPKAKALEVILSS